MSGPTDLTLQKFTFSAFFASAFFLLSTKAPGHSLAAIGMANRHSASSRLSLFPEN
jgi:hypothetical protein